MIADIDEIVLDNSKRSIFRQCKRKYFYQVVNGLQPNNGSTALRYGVTWHAIQEGYHRYVKEHGWPSTTEEYQYAIQAGLLLGKEKWEKESQGKTFIEDYKNFNTAVEAFGEYLEVFKEDRRFLEVIDTESKFKVPIIAETEDEKRLLGDIPPVYFAGKIDLRVRMDGMNWLFDFKTTGWRLDEVISKSNRSPQLIGYSYAGKHALDFEPSGCLLSFALISSRKSKTGEYGTVRHEFRRVPQLFTEHDIAAWKLAFIDTVREIYYAHKNNLWPESFDNCYQYGRCPYLTLCNQYKRKFDELPTEGFHVEFWDVLDE